MELTRKSYLEKIFARRSEQLSGLGKRVKEKLRETAARDAEEGDWLLYLAATLPVKDLAEHEVTDYLPFVRHALKLRKEVPWCRELPEDLFAEQVLYPRINTEDISFCRDLFYDLLRPRLTEKELFGDPAKMAEAALEVNYWAQENVTYQSADDRTASALTVYRSGSGRCGEESTFVVNALRSIGLPARQIYAPWWSHCDDNHAWVEVYADGGWHFLGACEPEPVLDLGWFTNASSRAMFVHTRTFSGAGSMDELAGIYGKERADRCYLDHAVTYELVTDHYAPVRTLNIRVLTSEGAPAANAEVFLEILNMAEMMPACRLHTDGQGCVRVMAGLGNVHVHAFAETGGRTLLAEENVLVREDTTVCLRLQEAGQIRQPDQWIPFDFTAPLDSPVHHFILDEASKKNRDERIDQGSGIRDMRRGSFYQKDRAEALVSADRNGYCYSMDVKELLRLSYGNFEEICSFLEEDCLGDGRYREALLKSISLKDLRDSTKAVLTDHLITASPFSTDYSDEIFIPYVLCPRVGDERLTDYRTAIENFFSSDLKKKMTKQPWQIWSWIRENLKQVSEMDYRDLYLTPEASLKSGLTDNQSSEILFVAIARTLGIPARLNPNTRLAEYLKGDAFVSPSRKNKSLIPRKKHAELSLVSEKPEDFITRQSFTLCRYRDGMYSRIECPSLPAEGQLALLLKSGDYRIHTVNRLPNGNMAAYIYDFSLAEGERKRIELRKREVNLSETLSRNAIDEFMVYTDDRLEDKQPVSSLLSEDMNILFWLEEGKEPTEHILNEMLAQKEEFRKIGADLIFLVRSREALKQPTLSRTLFEIPRIRVIYDDFRDHVSALGRRMYVDPEKLPLILVMRRDMTGIYASSGYNVGLADILIRIVHSFE